MVPTKTSMRRSGSRGASIAGRFGPIETVLSSPVLWRARAWSGPTVSCMAVSVIGSIDVRTIAVR